MYRDEETHEPHEYYCKLPEPIDQRTIVVVDPMLATGGSAVAAVDFIKAHGGKNIKFMSIIAAPEGIERLMKAHPDIQLYVGCKDRCLNENAYEHEDELIRLLNTVFSTRKSFQEIETIVENEYNIPMKDGFGEGSSKCAT